MHSQCFAKSLSISFNKDGSPPREDAEETARDDAVEEEEECRRIEREKGAAIRGRMR